MKKSYSLNNYSYVNSNDKDHRIGLHAINYRNIAKYWYFHGKAHRMNGPQICVDTKTKPKLNSFAICNYYMRFNISRLVI